MAKTGEVHKLDDSVIEWKIKNFFGLTVGVKNQYSSPSFSFANASWHLSVYPNGSQQQNSEGYVDLYLNRECSGDPVSLQYTLGLKAINGYANTVRNTTYDFQEPGGCGFAQFISRSELSERRLELSPHNVVTVICTLKYSKDIKTTDLPKSVTTQCSYCKKTLSAQEDISSHLQKCMEFPIKCPKCAGLIALKNWHNHKCQTTGIEVNEKLLNDFKSMMLSGDHSDVTIKVKGEQFKLHRNVLASRSSYFESMFNCNMKEKNTGNVTIDDCEPDVFRSFIHFMYLGKVDKLTVENVCDLYELADKYQEDQLKSGCLQFMMSEFSIDSFCDFTILAFKHDEKELLEKAIKFFGSKMKVIIRSVKWQTLLTKYPIQGNELLIKGLGK